MADLFNIKEPMNVQVVGHSQIPWSFGSYDDVHVELFKKCGAKLYNSRVINFTQAQFQYNEYDGVHFPPQQVNHIIERFETVIGHGKNELAEAE